MSRIFRKRTLRIWSLVLAVLLYMLPGLTQVAYAAAPISNTAYAGYTGYTFATTHSSTSNTVLTNFLKLQVTPKNSIDTGEQGGYAYLLREVQNIGSIGDTILFRSSNAYTTKIKYYLDTGVLGVFEPDIDTAIEINEAYLGVNDTLSYIAAVYVAETTTVGSYFTNFETIALYNFTETPPTVEEANVVNDTLIDTIYVINTIPPPAPHLLDVETQPTDAVVKIVWDTSNFVFDLAYYNIYRSTVSGGPYEFVDSTSYIPTYYNDNSPALRAGVTYYYVATAVDSYSNVSDTSNELVRLVYDVTAPETPTITSIVSILYGGALRIYWDTDAVDTDLRYYILERSTSSVFAPSDTFYISTPSSDTDSSDNVFYDSGLQNGVTYYYRLYRQDLRGLRSGASAIVSGVPEDQRAPDSPSGLVAVADTIGQAVTLTWAPTTDTDAVSIHIYRTTGTSFALIDTVPVSVTSYYDTPLLNGITYYYALTAVDTVYWSVAKGTWVYNESAFSDSVSVVPVDMVAPSAAPDSLSVVRVDRPKRRVVLSWNYPDTIYDLANFVIKRSTDAINYFVAGTTRQKYFVDTTVTDFAIDSITYAVVAADTWGNESEPDTAFVISLKPPKPIIFADTTNLSIVLEWAGNSATDSYYIYRSTADTSDTASYSLIAMLSTAVTQYKDISLDFGQTYYYVYTEVDSTLSESVRSDSVYAVAYDYQAPPKVTGLVATSDTRNLSIQLQWNPDTSADAAFYQIYRSTLSDTGFVLIDTVPVPSTNYVDGALVYGSTYYYRLAAVDSYANVSALSDSVWAVALDLVAPTAPYILSAISDTVNRDVELLWSSDTQDIAYFSILRSTGAGYSVIDTILYGATIYYDTSVEFTGQTYYYALLASDTYNNFSDSSNIVSVWVQDLTAPPAPDTLSATNLGDSNYLIWQYDTSSFDYYGFRIYRSTSLTDTFTLIDTVTYPSTYYYDANLAANVIVYYYYVTAIDTYGNESDSSNIDSAAILTVIEARAITGKLIRIIFTRDLGYQGAVDTSAISIVSSAGRPLHIEKASISGATLLITTEAQVFGDSYTVTILPPITPASVTIRDIPAGYIGIVWIRNAVGGRVVLPVQIADKVESVVLEIPAGSLPNAIDSAVFVIDTKSVNLSAHEIQIANYALERNSAFAMLKQNYEYDDTSAFKYVVEVRGLTRENGATLFTKTYHNVSKVYFNEKDTYPILYIPYDTSRTPLVNDKGEVIRESTLKIFYLDEDELQWKPLNTTPNRVYPDKGYVAAKLQHLSIYTIAGLKAEVPSGTKIEVYPNPYMPNSAAGHSHYIWFRNVPDEVQTIEIYDIAGDLVTILHRVDNLEEGMDGIDPPGAHWTATNMSGAAVASGVYIFVPKDKEGRVLSYAVGKIAIIK